MTTINIDNLQDIIDIPENTIKAIVSMVLNQEKIHTNELTVHFVTKESISELHNHYFNDPSPTDCISLPIDSSKSPSAYKILGDVFVCPEVAQEYAQEHSLDPIQEIFLYVIHGILHLVGYDDIKKSDRKIMRKKEKQYMGLIKEKHLDNPNAS